MVRYPSPHALRVQLGLQLCCAWATRGCGNHEVVLLAASEQSPEYTQRISAAVKAVKAHRAHKVSG